MSHPLTRVLTLLELLQSNARLTGAELADRLDTDVRAVVEGVLVDGGGEGVVDDRQGADRAGLFGDGGDGGDVEDVQGGVGRGLEEHDAGPAGQHLGQSADFVAAQEGGGDAELGQVVAEEFEGAAVDVADARDVLAGTGGGEEGGGFGGHARGERERLLAVFQVGELGLEGADGGVEAVAGVEVARLAALDDVEEVGGGVERERGMRVQRSVDRTFRIPVLAGAHAAGGQALRGVSVMPLLLLVDHTVGFVALYSAAAAFVSASAAVSISAGVLQRPSDRRTAPSARWGSRPIAVSTGDGLWVPLWQADPVEAATSGAAARSSCPAHRRC
jgi:hypothetical protein